MKKIDLKGKEVNLLTHREKAEELGISTKTLTRMKQRGLLKDISISLPRFVRPFYFPRTVHD